MSDHMDVIRRQLGEAAPKTPPPPELPVGGEIAWKAFAHLSRSRGHNGFGCLPIGFGEIDAWQRVMSTKLAAWEVEIILELDEAYLEVKALEAERNSK